MRISMCLCIGFLFLAGRGHGKEDKVLLKELSVSFVASLKEGSFKKAKALWATPDQMLKLVQSMPKDAHPPDLDEFKKYFQKRDKANQERFPGVAKDIKALEMNLKTLKHVATKATVHGLMGIKRVNMMRIEVADASDKKAIIRIDDGIKIGEKWYFSDRILDVSAKK